METPGISIFQGAESIKISPGLECQEEEEALEDKRRRDEELNLLVQNAFGDLDEEETTIDSTTNFQSELMSGCGSASQQQQNENHHIQHNQQGYPYVNVNNAYAAAHHPLDHNACEKEIHNLKMLLESRRRELENTQHLFEEEQKKSNNLEKKLTIIEAELDRALSNKKNNHELLVEAKEKISNLENTINKIKNEKKHLEAEKNELLGKLETTTTLLADAQGKYDMVKRDMNKNEERNFEIKLKQMEDRHRAEVAILQQQMEQVANKLDKKASELKSLNSRYQALQQSHEMMLCDKASKINDLSHALDEAQKRYEEFLSKPDYFQENIRLQKLTASLQQQINSMEKTINSLRERLEMATTELDSMNSLLSQYNQEDTPRRQSKTHSRVMENTQLDPLDIVGNFKKELYRALANTKSKREEIRKLQQSLGEKQTEIKYLKQEENNSLVQISTLKEENIKLQNKIKILEQDLDQLNTRQIIETRRDDNSLHALHMQLEDMKMKLNEEKQRVTELEELKLQHECERKKLDDQLQNVGIDLEELRQEHESLKLNYEQVLKENIGLKQRQTADNIRLELEKHKFLLKDSQAECDRLKNLYVEISNAKEALSYEMDKLLKTDKVKELQEEKDKVANLQRALKLAEVKSSELSKMLETEKLCHEKELEDLREKLEKKNLETTKAVKEAANECSKCMDYMAELTKFEIQNLKLTNINAISKKEIDELTQELKSSKNHISELNKQLKLSEQQEHLIKELKTKATQFEEYIKSHSSASEASNSSVKNSCQFSHKNVATSPERERNEIKKIEARIRDEMAQIFAIELKRFQNKLLASQEQILCLQREYQHIRNELQQRQTEVELLKQAILAEREKMDEILKQKEEEYNNVIRKQNITIQKIRDDLKTNLHKTKDLTHELNERQTQIEAERKSMKAVMKQWEEQRKCVDDVEKDWKQKFSNLQKAYENAKLSWQTKYNSARKTAAYYKRYSEDKEAHMLKEYDRLKIEYDAELVKIQLRMKECLERKGLELKKAANKKTSSEDNKENTASN